MDNWDKALILLIFLNLITYTSAFMIPETQIIEKEFNATEVCYEMAREQIVSSVQEVHRIRCNYDFKKGCECHVDAEFHYPQEMLDYVDRLKNFTQPETKE